jgi:hypothetical protein
LKIHLDFILKPTLNRLIKNTHNNLIQNPNRDFNVFRYYRSVRPSICRETDRYFQRRNEGRNGTKSVKIPMRVLNYYFILLINHIYWVIILIQLISKNLSIISNYVLVQISNHVLINILLEVKEIETVYNSWKFINLLCYL